MSEEPFELRHGLLLGLQGTLLVVVAGLRGTDRATSAPLIGILVWCVLVLAVYAWYHKTAYHVFKMTIVTCILLAIVILTLAPSWAFNVAVLLVGVLALVSVAWWSMRQDKVSDPTLK